MRRSISISTVASSMPRGLANVPDTDPAKALVELSNARRDGCTKENTSNNSVLEQTTTNKTRSG